MDQPIRYFFMMGYHPTVIDSQVFSWMEVTKELFKNNHIVNLGSKTEQKLSSDAKRDIERRIDGRYIEFRRFRYPIIRDLQLLWFVLRMYRNKDKQSTFLLQSRTMVFSFLMPVLRMLPSFRYIHEARGTAITEYMYARKNGNGKPGRYLLIRLREYMSLKLANKIICVSRCQKDFMMSEYGISKDKILVVPCAADSRSFYFSESLMHGMREELDISNRVVFLYSGRLDRLWHQSEVIFKTIKNINSALPESYFIMLTPNKNIAISLFTKHEIPDSDFMVDYADNKEIVRFLNAADYGFLIREDSPINHHASPTKFSEYVLCGLKVIMSDNIGDYSQFVKNHDCGVIGEFSYDGLNIDCHSLQQVSQADKQRISNIGKKYLSKDAYVSSIGSFIRELVNDDC